MIAVVSKDGDKTGGNAGPVDVSKVYDEMMALIDPARDKILKLGKGEVQLEASSKYLLVTKVILLEAILEKLPINKVNCELLFIVSASTTFQYIFEKSTLQNKQPAKMTATAITNVGNYVLTCIKRGSEINFDTVAEQMVEKLPNGYKRGLDENDLSALQMCFKSYAIQAAVNAGVSADVDRIIPVFKAAPSETQDKWFQVMAVQAEKNGFPSAAEVKLALQKTLREIPQLELGNGK